MGRRKSWLAIQTHLVRLRHWKRKPLIDLAKQLENIPGDWIWTAAWADGEFNTLEKAQRWTQEALTQI